MGTGEPSEGPHRQGLDPFLASLPELWREGGARPTHRKAGAKARHWRTREDPFKDVWTDILLWLEKEPDTNAKMVLVKLDEKCPGKFEDRLLRTLQRRIGEWRRTMAPGLVLSGVEGHRKVQAVAGQARLRLATLASAWPTLHVPQVVGEIAVDQEKDRFNQAPPFVTIPDEATGWGIMVVVVPMGMGLGQGAPGAFARVPSGGGAPLGGLAVVG